MVGHVSFLIFFWNSGRCSGLPCLFETFLVIMKSLLLANFGWTAFRVLTGPFVGLGILSRMAIVSTGARWFTLVLHVFASCKARVTNMSSCTICSLSL
jgi:hypothetical protein